LSTDRRIPAELPHTAAAALDRKAIDIIVPVYKSIHLTIRCLDSLANHIHEIAGSDPRLIVINDSPGESDGYRMLESFASRHSYVTVLENERNLGFVKTVNKGLDVASKASRDVILINADTETFAGTLKNLADAAYADPQIGFASPRSNNASICSLPHFYGGTVADQAESYKRWKVLSRTMPAFHFTPTGVGFYLYIKHAILANFGLLDPEFGLGYEEENDLIFRANKVGYRAVMVNNAFAYHAGSASFNLLDMNLPAHQGANLQKMAQRHAEYLPLVRRYEGSAHFRAEALLSHVLPSASGRLKLVFDLSSVGPNFNGTNEMGMAIIDGLYERHSSMFEFNVICSLETFKFHKLDRHERLRRHDAEHRTAERFAIGIQLGQPFSVHAISVLEDLAVINIFGMLDTIGDDCGYLSITHQLESLWGHIARHANGMFFISKFSEQCVISRYPDAKNVARYARLLPTKLRDYKKDLGVSAGEHVLIMGNHFSHKASDTTAEILKVAFPTIQFVVLGKENGVSRNVRTYRAGTLGDRQMESLYTRASIVVLPSHVEGFGFGLVHALAARKVVVARDIPTTREILSTYKSVSGVFLYAADKDVVRALGLAMTERASQTDDDGAESWHEWVDGFAEFCSKLVEQDDIFDRLARRILSGDLLRKSELLERLQSSAPPTVAATKENVAEEMGKTRNGAITDKNGRQWHRARHLKQLLGRDGEEFVYSAYVTLLNRLPDSDGLVNYLSELQSGIGKLEIVSRLRKSSEGQQSRVPLAGYNSSILRLRLRSLLSFAG
jgi:GT2 family glycosyltransferase/glycosyltransferase involved in cell wall biosynthesis